MDRCSKRRHWQGAFLCFKASALILSPPDRVVWPDFDSTPCIISCFMCLKPSGWDLCVGSVGAHCSRSRGPSRHSTRSLSTLSLTPFFVSAGCHSTSRDCGRRWLRVFLFLFFSLNSLYYIFFFLLSLFPCLLNSLVDWFSSRLMRRPPRWARALYGKVSRPCTTVGGVRQSNPHHACNVSFLSRPLTHFYHLSTCLRPRASVIRSTAMCQSHVMWWVPQGTQVVVRRAMKR